MSPVLGRMLKSVARTFTTAWALMILLGVLHHEVSAQVRPIGYRASFVVTLLAMWVVSSFAVDAAADIRTDSETEE